MDAIAGFLQNPMVLTAIGLLIKFFPPLAKIPNLAIPYINVLLAFLGSIAGPGTAHAGPVGVIATFGFLSFLGPVAGAVWASVQASLIHEVFLRHPIAAAGIKKAA